MERRGLLLFGEGNAGPGDGKNHGQKDKLSILWTNGSLSNILKYVIFFKYLK